MLGRIIDGAGHWDTVWAAWRALLEAHPAFAFTQLGEWARAAWLVGPPETSRWFVLDDADGALAVLHCTVRRRGVAGMPVRVLSNGSADGLVAARCRPDVLRREVLRAFARSGERIDVLSFNRMRPGSAFHTLATAWPGSLTVEDTYGGYATISTKQPADEWFAGSGRNLRANLRKAGNRLARLGPVQATTAVAPAAVAAGFDDFVRIEAGGWKGRAGSGLVNRPVEREMVRTFFVDAAAAGRVQVHRLTVGDDPAAVDLSVVVGETLVILKTAYDEEVAHGAPGNLLMAEVVRDCCDDPAITEIDLVTSQPWHARWHPTIHPTHRRSLFNRRTPVGLAAEGATRLRALVPRPGS